MSVLEAGLLLVIGGSVLFICFDIAWGPHGRP
jgi:hypothetical protein